MKGLRRRCALENSTDQLKEHRIGCDDYGRRPDYNPAEDNIVRVQAGLLRKRLADYFEAEGRNEPVVLRMKPEIERAKRALVKSGASGALLAGSGSSVFGVFDNQEAQERAFESLRNKKPWRIIKCATLARSEYLKALGECASLLQ